jgi:hypothetical protein
VLPDANEALARYDRGILYQSTGGGDALDAFFGETCIPMGYVTQQWALVEVLDYIDDRTLNLQNVIVTRKP